MKNVHNLFVYLQFDTIMTETNNMINEENGNQLTVDPMERSG